MSNIINTPEGYKVAVDLSTATHEIFQVKFRNKYSIHFSWRDLSSGGTVAVQGNNSPTSSTAKPLIDPNTGTPIELTVTSGTGTDYIRDHVGIVDNYMVLSFSGFTDGTVDILVNFAV